MPGATKGVAHDYSTEKLSNYGENFSYLEKWTSQE